MTRQRRTPLYELDPIRAGSQFLSVTIDEKTVPEGYDYNGEKRYVQYDVVATIGVVENTNPWSTPEDKFKRDNKGTFSTAGEAEARAHDIDTEYANRGWRYFDRHIIEIE
jgi:hypothetical protein